MRGKDWKLHLEAPSTRRLFAILWTASHAQARWCGASGASQVQMVRVSFGALIRKATHAVCPFVRVFLGWLVKATGGQPFGRPPIWRDRNDLATSAESTAPSVSRRGFWDQFLAKPVLPPRATA